MQYSTENKQTAISENIRQHLRVLARKYWWALVLLALFSTLDIAIGLLQPWPTKIFIDSVVGTIRAPGPLGPYTHDTSLLFIITALSAILFVIGSVSGYVQMRISAWLNFSIDRAIQQNLFEKIIELPPDTFSEHTTGDYLFRQTSETKAVADFIIEVGLTLFESSIKLCGAIVILLLINWQLGLIALAPVPIIFLSIRYFNPKIERQAKVLRETASKLFAFTEESISLSRLIRLFDRIRTQSAKLSGLLGANYQAGLQQRQTSYFFNLVNSTGSLLQSTVLLLVGGILILHGKLTIGELVVFFSYVSYLTNPLHAIASTLNKIKTLGIHITKVYEIIDGPTGQPALDLLQQPNQVITQPDLAPGKIPPLIAFRNVNIMRGGRSILSDVSFDVYSNEKVGIIGPSGSGKSTLFDVILGFIPRRGGEIYLSGQPIENFDVREVRQHFSVVSQESDLLTMSVADNIAFGSPVDREPSIHQIMAAAELANATEFIAELPETFDTMVGDASVHLSGGQKQRLSIARSLLRNAPILLLDEPTSALDRRSAKEVLDALRQLMANRTSLFITHDHSILGDMDRIYVIKDNTLQPIEAFGGLDGYEQSQSRASRPLINKRLKR